MHSQTKLYAHSNYTPITLHVQSDHISILLHAHNDYVSCTLQPHSNHPPPTLHIHSNHTPYTLQPHSMHTPTTLNAHSNHTPFTLHAHSSRTPSTLQLHSIHIPCTLHSHSRYLYEKEGCLWQGRPPLRSLCPLPHSIPKVVSLHPPHLSTPSGWNGGDYLKNSDISTFSKSILTWCQLSEQFPPSSVKSTWI